MCKVIENPHLWLEQGYHRRRCHPPGLGGGGEAAREVDGGLKVITLYHLRKSGSIVGPQHITRYYSWS